jgi:hypothetical protein
MHTDGRNPPSLYELWRDTDGATRGTMAASAGQAPLGQGGVEPPHSKADGRTERTARPAVAPYQRRGELKTEADGAGQAPQRQGGVEPPHSKADGADGKDRMR